MTSVMNYYNWSNKIYGFAVAKADYLKMSMNKSDITI
jgi:hypothetical protein